MLLMDLRNRIGKKLKKKKKKWSTHGQNGRGVMVSTCPGTAGARCRPFSGRFPSFCFQRMVLDLKNRIEKISKRKTKKGRMHRQNGGGVHPRAQSCLFPIQIA